MHWQTLLQGIDGSACSYTVNYTDSISGTLCATATISAASCMHSVCEHVLKLPSLLTFCPTLSNVTVTVFGTNRLGMGPPSNLTFTGRYS